MCPKLGAPRHAAQHNRVAISRRRLWRWRGTESRETSTIQSSQLHGLSHSSCNRSHLIGLGTLVHHTVQYLEQLGGVFLAINIKVLNDLLVGLMDVEVS